MDSLDLTERPLSFSSTTPSDVMDPPNGSSEQSSRLRRVLAIGTDQITSVLHQLSVDGSYGEVVVCQDLHQAYGAAANGAFDAVVVDVRRDGLERGIEAVSKLRQTGCTVPVVLVTEPLRRIDADVARSLAIIGLVEQPG